MFDSLSLIIPTGNWEKVLQKRWAVLRSVGPLVNWCRWRPTDLRRHKCASLGLSAISGAFHSAA